MLAWHYQPDFSYDKYTSGTWVTSALETITLAPLTNKFSQVSATQTSAIVQGHKNAYYDVMTASIYLSAPIPSNLSTENTDFGYAMMCLINNICKFSGRLLGCTSIL